MDILQNNQSGERLQGWLSIDWLAAHLLLLYIFTLPFVSAFALSGTITFTLITGVFLFLLMCLKLVQTGRFPEGFLGFDILVIGILLPWVIFSYCINGLGNAKSLNHTIAYISSFVLFYVTVKFTLLCARENYDVSTLVLRFIAYITIISAVFVCVEFFSANFLNLNLNEYIPRPSAEEAHYDASVLELFFRARGFAPESGHFTFMMELFFPFTLYYLFFSRVCEWNGMVKCVIAATIFFSIIFAVSSASFIIIPMAFTIASLVYCRKIYRFLKARLVKFIVVVVAVLLLLVIINHFLSLTSFIVTSLYDKMDSTSLEDRQERIDFFFFAFNKLDFLHQLCGTGPAGFDILGFDDSKSILSLYYSISFELGLIGLFMVCFLFLYYLAYAVSGWSTIGFFSLVAILSGILHYYFIANFWYPWFWFAAAFTIFSKKGYR